MRELGFKFDPWLNHGRFDHKRFYVDPEGVPRPPAR